tara:strand:- start:196 stop:459 length:264 start_codon:yes stop_codon:yes gene_type:complete
MKNLSKDEILSIYIHKVQVLKEIISSKSDKHCDECYKNSNDENIAILLEIKETDVLERVMGFDNLSLEERSKLILQETYDEVNDDSN